jgi:hypothetical protein
MTTRFELPPQSLSPTCSHRQSRDRIARVSWPTRRLVPTPTGGAAKPRDLHEETRRLDSPETPAVVIPGRRAGAVNYPAASWCRAVVAPGVAEVAGDRQPDVEATRPRPSSWKSSGASAAGSRRHPMPRKYPKVRTRCEGRRKGDLAGEITSKKIPDGKRNRRAREILDSQSLVGIKKSFSQLFSVAATTRFPPPPATPSPITPTPLPPLALPGDPQTRTPPPRSTARRTRARTRTRTSVGPLPPPPPRPLPYRVRQTK